MPTLSGAPIVTINGTIIPNVVSVPAIGDVIGQRAQVSLTIEDTSGSLALRDGHSIAITDGVGTPIFGGFVTSAVQQRIAYAPATYGWQVSCVDNAALADRKIAAASYASQTCGYIVNDLLTNDLAAEGVWAVRNRLSAAPSNGTSLAAVSTAVDALLAATPASAAVDTTMARWPGGAYGGSAIKIVHDATTSNEGVEVACGAVTAGTTYTVSCYYLGSGSLALRGYDFTNSASITGYVPASANGTTWQRASYTWTPATSSSDVRFCMRTSSASVTFWISGWQFEQASAVTTWALGDSGASSISAGPTLTVYPINYEPVSKHLDQLATYAGFYWNIDASKRLWFVPYNTSAAPYTFDGSQADDGTGSELLTIEHTSPQYRNGQYLLGITEPTSSQTETRKGDGTTTTFVFSYPLHKVPTITLNGASQTVGIAGVDSGKNWYWSKGSNAIAQDSGGTKLLATDTLSVTYVGEYETLVYSQDDGQVATQKALEGNATSGVVQAVTTDKTVTTSAQGFQAATALLAKYATAGKKLVYKSLTGGVQSGQLLTVNLPSAPWNIANESFLIESVTYTFDGFQWWYTVTALEGPVSDTWVKFFQRIAATVGVVDTSSSATNATVSLLQSVSESWTWTESVSETVYTCFTFPVTFPKTFC